MTFDDEVPLSLLTMVVGAVLGAVLVPLGRVATERIQSGKGLKSLDSAFILFFVANGIWIIAEIFVELFIRLSNNVTWWTALAVASIFSLAAFTFAIGYGYVPRGKEFEASKNTVAQSLKLLIVGNMLWIAGEIIETFGWQIAPNQPRILIHPVTWLRLICLTAAIWIFARGLRAVWHPPQPVDESS
jgi:hypothetical protein